MNLRTKATISLVFISLLLVVFVSGCISNQSTMQIGDMNTTEDHASATVATTAPVQTTTDASYNVTTLQPIANIGTWMGLLMPVLMIGMLLVLFMGRR